MLQLSLSLVSLFVFGSLTFDFDSLSQCCVSCAASISPFDKWLLMVSLPRIPCCILSPPSAVFSLSHVYFFFSLCLRRATSSSAESLCSSTRSSKAPWAWGRRRWWRGESSPPMFSSSLFPHCWRHTCSHLESGETHKPPKCRLKLDNDAKLLFGDEVQRCFSLFLGSTLGSVWLLQQQARCDVGCSPVQSFYY